MIERPTDPPTTARVRAMCMALDGVEERLSHGDAAWFARGRAFAMVSDHHHDDRVALWLAAPAGRQESLVETDRTRFFRPPSVGHRGWVGVFLDVPGVDWKELGALLADAPALVDPPSRRGR